MACMNYWRSTFPSHEYCRPCPVLASLGRIGLLGVLDVGLIFVLFDVFDLPAQIAIVPDSHLDHSQGLVERLCLMPFQVSTEKGQRVHQVEVQVLWQLSNF